MNSIIRRIWINIWMIMGLFVVGCSGPIAISDFRHKSEALDSRSIELFSDGVVYDLNHNYAAALLCYQEALLYDSTSSYLYLVIGRDYIALGKTESALIHLKKSLELNPQQKESLILISRIYTNQGRFREVEKLYKKVISQDSDHLEALNYLAVLYLNQNQILKAIDTYEKILTLQNMPSVEVLIDLGELYLQQEQFKKAETLFHRLIELQPINGFGYYGMGIVKERTGDTTGAIKYYTKAIDISPDLIQAIDGLGELYINSKEWEEATKVYLKAVERDSSDMVSWLKLGEISRLSSDTIETIQLYHTIKERFPDHWRPYSNFGRFLMDIGKFDSAASEFKKVIQLTPNSFIGNLFYGVSLFHLDSLESAVGYLLKAVEIAPHDPLGNYYLGSTLSQFNRFEEAIPYLKKALAVRPKWILAMSVLAGIYERLKAYALSDSLFQAAIKIDTANAFLMNNYGYSLSERGIRLEEAMDMVKKAIKIDPDNSAYLDTMGWIYYKMGLYEKALDYIQKAIMIQDDNAILIDHLGDVYNKLGIKEKAREAWQRALRIDQGNSEILKKLEEGKNQ